MVTINSDSVVLFLDFDGVLHPRGGALAGERFSKKSMLEELLREPALLHILLVISSTWREAYPLKSLVSIFSEDIQPRIIGATPILNDIDAAYQRYREIKAWLIRHPEVNRWVALDDAAGDFPQDGRLSSVFTDPDIGLKNSDIDSLRRLLERA
jgi:hypothetical protein